MGQDDRGITLIEMIIAIAAAVIVMGAAALFIRNAVRGYQQAEDMIDVQLEAQVLMEQLATWIMEGNSYEDQFGNFDPKENVFIIYHIPNEPPEGVPEDLMGEYWMRIIWWCSDTDELYMYRTNDKATVLNTRNRPAEEKFKWNDGWTVRKNLIGDYIKEFNAQPYPGNVNTTDYVNVTLVMKAGIKDYELRDEIISVRNAAYKQ